jgi:crossover junction endodeoxyribonuclease RuvC
MRILGIDPGSARIGFGLIEAEGSKLELIKSGLLKIESSDKEDRLLELANSFEKLVEEEKPDLVSIEKLFFVKNIKTGMDVAQSRGIIILICKQKKVAIVEYAPSEIKMNITGSGNADKKAVAKMVKMILKTDKITGPDDVYDAIAIAITAANNKRIMNKEE